MRVKWRNDADIFSKILGIFFEGYFQQHMKKIAESIRFS